MATFLSQADVARLMDQPSPHVRAVIANKLAQEIDQPKLTEGEIQIAHDIIRAMSKDVEVVVRRSLAQSLRHSKRLPHDVAVRLAQDVEVVALPILTDSLVLTDEDLIEVLQQSTNSAMKQKAIACRPDVSEKLSDAVITLSGEIAVTALMNNKTAKINDKSYIKAVERFAASDLVKESIVKRDRLPITVTERLVTIVSDKLREHLATHHELPKQLATEIMAQSRERVVIQLSHDTSPEDTEKLVDQMKVSKRLTPNLIIRALCQGNLVFFEYAVAARANISIVNARTLIHDGGTNGLKSLCDKAEIPPQFFQIIRIALDIMHQLKLKGEDQDVKRYRATLIERVMAQAEALGHTDLSYLSDLIK